MMVSDYQPLTADSAFIECLPRGLRVTRGNRPDKMGRSVAPLAQLHPKCPFQVVLQRVRT